MEWFKKHTDTVIILAAFAASVLWMNGKFNEINNRFFELEKDIAVVKTVLLIQKILPSELAKKE
jgi:hypothetical protein